MTIQYKTGLLLSSSFVLASALNLPVYAQSSDDNRIRQEDEMVVTAQRREQNLMDVPLAIDAIGGDQIQFEGIEDVQRLAEELPSLVVGGQSSTSGGVAISVRGIGSVSGDPAVGFYIDEVYQASSSGFVTQFLDVERVEVLKGPQGTLWGRNTTGGAVHYVTKSPEIGTTKGNLYGEVGFYDSLDTDDFPITKFGGAINVALGEDAALRVSAAKVNQDNYTFNTALGGTQKNQDATTLRGDILWEPSDDFTLKLGVTHIDDPFHNAFTTKADPFFPGSATEFLLNLISDVDVESDTFRVSANAAPEADFKETGVRLGMDYNLNENVILRSITAYKTLDSVRSADLDATRFTLTHNGNETEHDWWSQEVQVLYDNDKVNAIGGLYYFSEDRATRTQTTANLAPFLITSCNNGNTTANPNNAALCPIINGFILPSLPLFNGGQPLVLADLQPGGLWDTTVNGLGLGAFGLNATDGIVSGSGSDTETDSFAIYGQASYNLSDTVSATVGARWTQDERDIAGVSFDTVTGNFVPNPQATGKVKDDAFTPKVGLEYRPNDDALYYASYTRGYKAGDINTFAGNVPNAVFDINPETMNAFEAGFKGAFNDGQISLDGAAFFYDYSDYQFQVQFVDGPQLQNIDDVEVLGAEAAIRIHATDNFNINASGSYVDSQIKSDLNIVDPINLLAGASNVRGASLPRVPDFKATIGADYTVENIFSSASLNLAASMNYSDEFNHDLFGTFTGGGYTTFNANARLLGGEGDWWLNVYARNITNEEYQTLSIFTDFTGELQFFAPPRTVGLQVGYNFN